MFLVHCQLCDSGKGVNPHGEVRLQHELMPRVVWCVGHYADADSYSLFFEVLQGTSWK